MLSKTQQQTIYSLFDWYAMAGRDLPWRHTSDPYAVLVSEIMLQQTQVDRVITKWNEFLAMFPTVEVLAQASPADVITAWQGLGYNRRALFLQRTAQAVVSEYDGVFPHDLEALKALPGIGDYTARAVLSFAFDAPVPMMDTNHRKFYTRLLFDGQPTRDAILLQEAETLFTWLTAQSGIDLPKDLPFGSDRSLIWHMNQALMDIMSVAAKKEKPFVIETFVRTYPLQEPAKKKKKQQVPFRQTNRYIRGQIIDLLREKEQASIHFFITTFAAFPKDRIIMNIDNLLEEGLIQKEKQSIMLTR